MKIPTVDVPSEAATTGEAVELLIDGMSPSKVARVLSSWQIGHGDYTRLRAELFEGESVETLIRGLQNPKGSQESNG